MGVHVQGDADGGVAKAFLYDLGVLALAEHQRCGGVSQSTSSHAPAGQRFPEPPTAGQGGTEGPTYCCAGTPVLR